MKLMTYTVKVFVWFLWFFCSIHSVHSDSSPLREYALIISSNFQKDSVILNLKPIAYHFLPAKLSEIYKYDVKLSNVEVNFGGKIQRLEVMLSRFSCNTSQPLPAYQGYICIDDENFSMKTTKWFNPEESGKYEYKFWFLLTNHKTNFAIPFSDFVIKITIRKPCEALQSTHSALKECQPNLQDKQRSGFTADGAVEFKLSTIKLKRTPIMLTMLRLPGFKTPSDTTLFLKIKRSNGDVIQDKEVTSFKKYEVQLNTVEVDTYPTYSVEIRTRAGEALKLPNGIKLRYFKMTSFCNGNIKCYSDVEHWSSMFGKQICNGKTESSLDKHYSACKDISFPGAPTLSSNKKEGFLLGDTMELTCNLAGDLYIPYIYRIEILTDESDFTAVSYGSAYKVPEMKHTDYTYYRCILTTITDRVSVYTSKLFLAEISDIFKTKLVYTLNVDFTQDLFSPSNQEYQKMEQQLGQDISILFTKRFGVSEKDIKFDVLRFERDSGNLIEVHAMISLSRTTEILKDMPYNDWLKNLSKTIGDELPKQRKASNTKIFSYSSCVEQNTTSVNKQQQYEWSTMKIGQTQSQPCWNDGTKNVIATCLLDEKKYVGKLVVDEEQCPDQVDGGNNSEETDLDLETISQMEITSENAQNRSERVLKISENSGEFSAYQFQLTVNVLKKMVDFLGTSNGTRENVFQILDNILETPDEVVKDGQMVNETSARLLEILGKSGENLATDTPFIVSKDNFALGTLKVRKKQASNLKVIAKSNPTGQLTMGMLSNAETSPGDDSQASITIPSSVISNLNGGDDVSFVAIVYDKNKLFQELTNETKGPSSRIVGTYVMSAEFRQHQIKNTKEEISLKFKLNEEDVNKKSARCSFWNITENSWSTKGMSFISINNKGIIECKTNHLTNFAVMFNAKGREKDETHEQILNIITYIGLAISMAGALIILLTYALFSVLREAIPPKILMNLCFALLLMSLIFIAGAERNNKSKAACQTVSFLLQYSLLAVFTWSGIEGFHSARGLVFPMKTEIRNFVKKALAIGWLVPLVFTGIGFGVWPNSYVSSNSSCVVTGKPFYVTLIAPVAFIILFNIISLVAIMFSLKTSSKKYTTHALTPKERARIITAFLILFGLTWIFGFFVINNDVMVFQYLFCIISSIQGLYLFIFYGLRKEKVRLFWMALLRGRNPTTIQRSSTRQLRKGKKNKDVSNTDISNDYTLSTVSNKNGNHYVAS